MTTVAILAQWLKDTYPQQDVGVYPQRDPDRLVIRASASGFKGLLVTDSPALIDVFTTKYKIVAPLPLYEAQLQIRR